MDLIIEQSFREKEKNKISRLCAALECALDSNNKKEVDNYHQVKKFLEEIIVCPSFVHLPLSDILSFFDKNRIPKYISATVTAHHSDRMRCLYEQLEEQVHPYQSNFLDFKQLLIFLFTPEKQGLKKQELQDFFDAFPFQDNDVTRVMWGCYQSKDEHLSVVVLANR